MQTTFNLRLVGIKFADDRIRSVVCAEHVKRIFKVPLIQDAAYTMTISSTPIKGSKLLEFERVYMACCFLDKDKMDYGLHNLLEEALYRFINEYSTRKLYVSFVLDDPK